MCFLKSKELMLIRADKIKVAILKNYYLLGDCLVDNNYAWDFKGLCGGSFPYTSGKKKNYAWEIKVRLEF